MNMEGTPEAKSREQIDQEYAEGLRDIIIKMGKKAESLLLEAKAAAEAGDTEKAEQLKEDAAGTSKLGLALEEERQRIAA